MANKQHSDTKHNEPDKQPAKQDKAEKDVNTAQAATAAEQPPADHKKKQEKPVAVSEARIEALEKALEAAKNETLRTLADSQNSRRRAEKDVAAAHKYALDKFVRELLPIVDNLERALELDQDKDTVEKSLIEGVQLTYRNFIDVLQKFAVEQISPQGEPFDPQLHQAVSTVEQPDSEPNTVINVMQKGYQLNGRLLRPAMVVVAK